MDRSSRLWVFAHYGALLVLSSACAGAESAAEAVSGPPLIGKFIDSAVSGLDFATDSGHGITNIAGEFSYHEGQMVSFAIGELKLGEAEGASVLTPLSITSGASSAEDQRVNNKLILLQTLDADGDLNNGIQINAQARTYVSNRAATISFDSAPTTFIESLAPLLTDLNTARLFSGADTRPRVARGATSALDHFTRSMSERNQVRTTAGTISGFAANADTWQYLGVAYAEPPIGDFRWKNPQPLRTWPGVRDAIAWGNQAPQNPMYQAYGEGGMSEDCLYLNITAPKNASNLPVMVWFHGGGFVILTGNTKTFNNPGSLPTKGVVLVTVNHRLGPFGYLAHPLLTQEAGGTGSGNYGQMDLIAALDWIKSNIGRFGGDPANVTIFGESGGGGKVISLMSSPLAAGLFHKAISQSGQAEASNKILNVPTLAAAEEVGKSLFSRLGEPSLFRARELPWLDIIQAELSFYPNGDYKDAYGPSIDGRYNKVTMEESIKAGLPSDVPFMAGANSGDMPGLIKGLQEQMPWRSMFNKAAQYVYKFSKVPSGWAAQGVLSYHGGELTYVFNYPPSLATHFLLNLVIDPATNMRVAVGDLNGDGVSGTQGDVKDILASAGFGPEDTAVADTVMTHWTNFAKTGDPSTASFVWAPYTAASDTYAEITATVTQKTGLLTAFTEAQAAAPNGTANQGAP
jgi:para-nitrobenzyl esterase